MFSGQNTKPKSFQIFSSVLRLQEEHERRNLLNTWGFYEQNLDKGSSGINDGYPDWITKRLEACLAQPFDHKVRGGVRQISNSVMECKGNENVLITTSSLLWSVHPVPSLHLLWRCSLK